MIDSTPCFAANYANLRKYTTRRFFNATLPGVDVYTQALVACKTTKGDSGGGLFYWDSSDLSAEVTADPTSETYVAPNSDLTGASGSWVRQPVGVSDHTLLSNIGTLTHTQLESAIGGKEAAGVAAGLDGDHLSAFTHSNIHSPGSDNQDLTPYLKKDGSVALTGDLDANYKQLLNAADHNDVIANIPVTGNEVEGQTFLANDICTLFKYCDGTWNAQQSFDAVTLYVDGTNGTDAVGKGYASGTGAFATIPYTKDALPALNGGNVLILVANGTFTGQIVLQGKEFSGPYTLTIQGTLSTADDTGTATSATQYAMGAAGVGAVQSTLVDTAKTWTATSIVQGASGKDYFCLSSHTSAATTQPEVGATWRSYWSYSGSAGTGAAWVTATAYNGGQHANKLLIITGGTGSGQERIIDSHNTTTLKIVGKWDTTPDATSTYSIYDLANTTTLDGSALTTNDQDIIELNNQKSVKFKYLNFINWYNYAVYQHDFSAASFYSCRFYHNRNVTLANAAIQVETLSSIPECFACLFLEGDTYKKLSRGIRLQQAAAAIEGNNIRNIKTQGMTIGIAISALSFQNHNSSGHGWVIRGARTRGIYVTSLVRADITECIVTGSVVNNILVEASGLILVRNKNEISFAGADGIVGEQSQVWNVGTTTTQINNNGGWGFSGKNLDFGKAVSTISYTGNTSGTYTNDATSVNS